MGTLLVRAKTDEAFKAAKELIVTFAGVILTAENAARKTIALTVPSDQTENLRRFLIERGFTVRDEGSYRPETVASASAKAMKAIDPIEQSGIIVMTPQTHPDAPGMNWKLSDEAKQALDEIDDNLRAAAIAVARNELLLD